MTTVAPRTRCAGQVGIIASARSDIAVSPNMIEAPAARIASSEQVDRSRRHFIRSRIHTSDGFSPPRAVGDVILALHLDQARDGALELEGAVAGDIDFVGRYFGRGDQQRARLVERVDQDVEASGLVAALRREAWDRLDDHGRETSGYGEVVGRGERLGAKVVEA